MPRALLLFIAAFAVSSFAARRVLPPFGHAVSEAKLAHLQRSEPAFDIAVLGSSQVYYGFDPARFDRRLGERGVTARTFNAGAQGVKFIESVAQLERLAAESTRQLQYVLVEADALARMRDELIYLTRKHIAWHDFRTLAQMWPYIDEFDVSDLDKAKARWRCLVSSTYYQLGLGRGVPWIEAAIGCAPSRAEQEAWLGPESDGFRPIAQSDSAEVMKRRRQYLQNRAQFAHLHDQFQTRDKRVRAPRMTAWPFFERMERAAEKLGARVVYFSLRGEFEGFEAAHLHNAGLLDDFISFADTQRFPELYDVDYFYEGTHFNARGAAAFTDYLAEAFLELVKP